MKIDKSSTIGFLFGYFLVAKFLFYIIGFHVPVFTRLLDAVFGLMFAILWGVFKYKLKENGRIQKRIAERKNKG